MTSPPTGTKTKDTRLFDLVFQRIEKNESGSISFSEFLEIVLYHPELGYYADPAAREVGRDGDFFTSVSVGETFGMLLARAIEERMREAGRLEAPAGEPFRIVEQGAHDGRLALDIVSALRERVDPVQIPWQYLVIEAREPVRGDLLRRFEGEGVGDAADSLFGVVASPAEAAGEEGIFLCNELLDAFPFDRLVRSADGWQERCVVVEDGAPTWGDRPLSERLRPFAEELGDDLPVGYATEVCPGLFEWVAEVAGLFRRGEWWVIDYGFESDDYFAPHRTEGTFRCYREHRASEDPFAHLGETDITAHVNFTHLRRAAEDAGLDWLEFTDQHHFLIEAARPWLLEHEGQLPDARMAARLRQFQTLTHPGMMGKQFKVARLGRH